MFESLKEYCDDAGNKDKLNLLVTAFADALMSLHHHIVIRPVIPTTVAEFPFTLGKEKKETPGRPCFDIPAGRLEKLRGLGFAD